VIIRLLSVLLIGLSGCTFTVNCGCSTPAVTPVVTPAVVPTVVPVVTPTVTPSVEPVKPPETLVGGVKWFVVIVDPSDISQAIWRTDRGLRDALASKGVQIRSYVSTEEDLDQLGYRATVRSVGVPCVILQDANGKLVKAIRPTTLADVVAIAEAIQ
jgi:hypothetical protein